jgi:hypothetical protein
MARRLTEPLLSAAPLHSPGSSMDGWHIIGFLMLVGGFVAFGYGRNIRRGGERGSNPSRPAH